MAKQDDWTRITVRLPPEVYGGLLDAVAKGPNSLNAEIVGRLKASLVTRSVIQERWDTPVDERRAALADTVDMLMHIQEYFAKLPDDASVSRKDAVEIALNTLFRRETERPAAVAEAGRQQATENGADASAALTKSLPVKRGSRKPKGGR